MTSVLSIRSGDGRWAIAGTITNTSRTGAARGPYRRPARLPLYSVDFLNRQDGCAVGGYAQSYPTPAFQASCSTPAMADTWLGDRSFGPADSEEGPFLRRETGLGDWLLQCGGALGAVRDGKRWPLLESAARRKRGRLDRGRSAGSTTTPWPSRMGRQPRSATGGSARPNPAVPLRGLAGIRLVPPYYR